MVNIKIILVILSLLCVSCVEIYFDSPKDDENTNSGEEYLSYITVDDLKTIINGNDLDSAYLAFNAIKTMDNKYEQLILIRDLWEGKSIEGIENTQLLDQKVAQAEIVNVLIQAGRNGLIEVDEDRLHADIKSLVSSENPKARRIAVSTLSIFDRCTDVQLLKDEAIKEDRITFRSSALSLRRICCTEADDALEQLNSVISGSANKRFVNELLTSTMDLEMSEALCSFSRQWD